MPNQIQNSNISIFSVGVSNYDYLQNLPGIQIDLARLRHVLVNDDVVSLFSSDRLFEFFNPTLSEVQSALVEYINGRSARGDILIFYFSGHGAVLGNGDFYFCLKDTNRGFDNQGFLPLSALSFREVINSISMADIYPCFIIDACFSGASINSTNVNIGLNLEYLTENSLGSSYSILSSSGADSFSLGNMDGGYFTNNFVSILENGLPRSINDENVTLQNIVLPLNNRLAIDGSPLTRLHIGSSFPILNLCKNRNYRTDIRTERFVRSYKPLFDRIWNDGDPIPFTPEEIRSEMPSAYGNNKKFDYIWGLIEEIEIEGLGKVRKLTNKGKRFCQNVESIPVEMIKLPNSDEWIPRIDTNYITLSDLN